MLWWLWLGVTVTVLAGAAGEGFAAAKSAARVNKSSTTLTITSPAAGSTVSATVTIQTYESSNISWINVFADGVWFASNDPAAARPYSVPWDSTRVSNGSHTISVTGYSSTNQVLATCSEALYVANNAPSATPAPSPTPVPTPTRTAMPTATKTAAPTPTNSAVPTASPSPAGTVYYVAPTGSDSAAGTAAAPWRTIQHAVSKLGAGQTAIVEAGNYAERVSIATSGSAGAPITLEAASGATVRTLGFSISGAYWVIAGFDISTQANTTDGYGIYIFSSAHHDTISNNYIHELCHEGIFMEPTVSYITLKGNRIWRAEMAGAQVDGAYNLIDGNEVWDTQQKPSLLGGIYSACNIPTGADADAFRFFGQHHDFIRNYMHDIAYGTIANPNPHTDCFQTWGSSAMKVDAVVFERNWCRWPTTAAQNHSAMLEGTDGPVGTLIFKNNVFADMQDGLIVGEVGMPSGVAAVKVWNNTFDHIAREAVQFNDSRTSADEVIDNIFFDVGSGGDSFMCVAGGAPLVAANDFYMRGGAVPGTYCSSAPYISVDPLFANDGDATGAGADYHLQSGSPIKDNGAVLAQVGNDYDGTVRPIGPGPSMGAFEK